MCGVCPNFSGVGDGRAKENVVQVMQVVNNQRSRLNDLIFAQQLMFE